MFKDFQPAIIKLKDGKQSVHKQTNIFLKNSSLVYKKVPTGEIMEASMPIVAGITMGERNFINVKNQLAEVVATEGNKVSVCVWSVEHPMLDAHYIQWIAIETTSGCQLKQLTPQDAPEAVFKLAEGQSFKAAYAYCNLHGLWKSW